MVFMTPKLLIFPVHETTDTFIAVFSGPEIRHFLFSHIKYKRKRGIKRVKNYI